MFIPGLGNIKKYFQTVKYVMKVPINFGKYILMSGKNYTILKIIILKCYYKDILRKKKLHEQRC